MAFEDYAYEDNWEKAGFEEGFEVEWTQANYELPHVSGVARLYFVLIYSKAHVRALHSAPATAALYPTTMGPDATQLLTYPRHINIS